MEISKESCFEERGNHATAWSSSERIKTVEALVRACGIDLKVWQVEKVLISKWEGYRKDQEKDLVFEEGKITGFLRDGGKLTIEPLWRIEAQFVRKKPVALQPVISPVVMKAGRLWQGTTKRQEVRQFKLALLLADPHFGFQRDMRTGRLEPFHDRAAISVALKMAEALRPDLTVVMGDVLDLAEWTDKYLRGPEMYFTTQPAVIEAAWVLGQLRRYSEVKVLEGNHDQRLEKMLIKHFASAYDLRPADRLENAAPVSVANLLGLEGMGIEYIGDYPKGSLALNERIEVTHGHVARKRPGATSAAMLETAERCVGFGHIHRIEMLSKATPGGGHITAFCPGCLCRVDGKVPGATGREGWQQGVGIVGYAEDGDHYVDLAPIEGRKAVYRGRIYEAEDYAQEMQAATGYPFNGRSGDELE